MVAALIVMQVLLLILSCGGAAIPLWVVWLPTLFVLTAIAMVAGVFLVFLLGMLILSFLDGTRT